MATGGSGLVSTDAPAPAKREADGRRPPPPPPPRAPRSSAWPIAVAAGVVALVGALLLPFAPVAMSTPEVRWPLDPAAPEPTMLMLTAYEPSDLEARFSCRAARAAATTPDGVVLSTMGPTSRDAATAALTVTSLDGGVSVRSDGDELFAGPLPPGECRFVVAGDATALRVVLDGRVVATATSRAAGTDPDRLPESEPDPGVITPLPEIDALRSSVPPMPGATSDDLSVRLELDDAFDHTPAPSKVVLIVVIVTALGVGAVAVSTVAWRGPPAGAPRGRPRPLAGLLRLARLARGVDVVVPVVLLAWLFLAPMTDDDGYYSAMAANVPFSGYVPNFYQLYNQGYTPFSWPYYALSWWQTTVGVAPVPLRIPALVLGLGTWVIARTFVARTGLGGSGRRVPRAARWVLAAAFLAWWLPYDMGVRPEPVVAFFTTATLLAVAEGLERRRLDVLGVAVGLAAAGAAAAPTGFIALAPLVAAAPAVRRLVRQRSASPWAAAGSWVVVLAPLAVGSLLGFADGAYRDFVRSQEIFAPIQRAQTWYQEFLRYDALLDTFSHHGSYARRAAVLVCLLALLWFVVLVVAARVRDLAVPSRLPLAGWSTLLAFLLLLPTPSKPTHHLGAFAGLGAVFLALVLVVGPGLVGALDRERRVPRAPLVAAGVSAVAVIALAWHGRAMWPYGWGLGMPSYGDYPSIDGLELDQPFWWALALAAITAGVTVLARHVATHRRRPALALAVPALVAAHLVVATGWTLGEFARAAARTSDTWSLQADAWDDPAGTRCGLAGQLDVLDPRDARALPPVVLPGEAPPAPALPVDAPDAPPPEQRTEAFVPGAVFPDSPAPEGLPPEVPVWGSFLVPERGANADARTGTTATGWYRLPPATRSAPEAGLAVAVSGRTGQDVTLRVEYGRETPDGVLPLGGRAIGTDETSVSWRTVPLLGDAAPPAGATTARLVATDASTTTGGWLAFTAPVERRWVPLSQYLSPYPSPGGAVGVAWQINTLFPCQRQPRQQSGITEPAVAAIGYGDTPEEALRDWTFDPARGGVLGHAEREADVTPLVTRVRDVGGEIDDIHVFEYRQPYPGGRYDLRRERRTVSGAP